MIGKILAVASLLVASLMTTPSQAHVTEREWADYAARFVSSDGRIIDDGNGNISHSEGQGYGLLLAYLAGNRPDFERIWSFTQRELLIRDDQLAAWSWDPNKKPNITDLNNASDGDILIAYALAQAGNAWNEARFLRSAATIATALGQTSVIDYHGEKLLMPGVVGFGANARKDGPVVNPSYWIFEAFPVLARLAPETDWQAVADSGKRIIAKSALGTHMLPAEWLSLASAPKPARGFPAEFGYNALRIPLYLMRAMDSDTALLKRLRDGMSGTDGALMLYNLVSGKATAQLTDPGYRIIPALASCVLDGTRLPADLGTFSPTIYYPSTLHLLALSHIREDRPECL
jgi:endo-1,4-beta-D-glucanase Y